jgi:hypothetical protein
MGKLLPALLIAAASCGGRTTLDEPLTMPEQSDASAPSTTPVVVNPQPTQPQPTQPQPTQPQPTQPQPTQPQPTQPQPNPPALGEGGATGDDCVFDSETCGRCVVSRCTTEVQVCVNDASCPDGLQELESCACQSNVAAASQGCLTELATHGSDSMALAKCLDAFCGPQCGL